MLNSVLQVRNGNLTHITESLSSMASLNCSALFIKRHIIIKSQLHRSELWRAPKPPNTFRFSPTPRRSPPLLCTQQFSWEASPQYRLKGDCDSIVKGSNIIETLNAEDKPELPILQSEKEASDAQKQSSLQLLKWPLWLLGPSILLLTGMVPTLWLPLSSVFLGPNIAGLLSLVGLDCLFNMGATLFLLMADACAYPNGGLPAPESRIPLTYRLWNLLASVLGLLVPLVMLFASNKGFLQPYLPFISFAVLLGPYLLLLCTQMLTEVLTWHWKSPVWLMTPVVYESYRVLQLMRGLKLAGEINAPMWVVHSIRGLVSWWILILGVQLMRVAWFAGSAYQAQKQT